MGLGRLEVGAEGLLTLFASSWTCLVLVLVLGLGLVLGDRVRG